MKLKLPFLKRLQRSERGVAAIEFALLAPIFFAIMFAIIETALVFFADMLLQNALLDNSRTIRTGAALQNSVSYSQFKTDICDDALILTSCSDNLKLQVIKISSTNLYTAGQQNSIIWTDFNQLLSLPSTYEVGVADDLILIRGYYEWQMVTGFMTQFLTNANTNRRIIGGAVVIKNEPF